MHACDLGVVQGEGPFRSACEEIALELGYWAVATGRQACFFPRCKPSVLLAVPVCLLRGMIGLCSAYARCIPACQDPSASATCSCLTVVSTCLERQPLRPAAACSYALSWVQDAC